MRKKILSLLLSWALCALFVPIPAAQAVSTSARCAILMEASSGRVLYAQNEGEVHSIASITKLLTALTAAELCPDVDAPVTVDPAAVGAEGSSMYLTAGEVLPLRHLLYGLLLRSGNDAANAIAIHCSGSVEAFAQAMNRTAQRLGMTHSHFMNPSGLEQEGHFSCAYDMALCAQAFLAQPVLAEIAATKSVTLGTRTIQNHNKLLWSYSGCVGLKTGFTKKAGRTLVSAATRGGTTLIAVTLNDGDDWRDHTALLDYGFSICRSHLLCRAGKGLGLVAVSGSLVPAVRVETQSDVRWCLTADEAVTAKMELPRHVQAPVNRGQVLGSLTFYLNGQEIGRTAVVAAAAAPENKKR